jgi:hypothetical protein
MIRSLLISALLIFSFSVINITTYSQEVAHPVNNSGVYEFLDELAAGHLISINSAVKPYSRLFIANKLNEASKLKDRLSPRQQKELGFYLLDFRKELIIANQTVAPENKLPETKASWLKGKKGQRRRDFFYYQDSLFSLTINPILGGEFFTNSSGQATYLRNGLEARAYVKNWGFYASLRDNHEKPLLGKKVYLTQREGGHLKGNTDWSEMQGGITYSWKWGNAGLVKDKITWGNNYNGANIFGGNNPTFIQLRLHLNPVRWFNFDYFHGWLNSMVVDSARSYWVTNSYGTDYREKNHRKYIAANLFTFTPFKYLNISAGNSIIYDDTNVNPAYFMPLFFYKSVDHSVSSGVDNMNSQMFFDISSRQIKNLHLYATLFVDELSTSRFTMKDEWNFLSWKAGFRLSNFPIRDLAFTGEFTYTYPLTFQHYVPTLTFESNGYNLGHYLRDNSREWFVAIDYRPFRTLDIRIWFSDAVRGPDYVELATSRVGNPPLDSINWQNTSYGIKGSCQVINDLYVWASFAYGDINGDARWSSEYFFGKRKTFNLGLTLGF